MTVGVDADAEHLKGDVWERDGERAPVLSTLWTNIGIWLTFPRPLGRRAVDDMVAAGWTRVEREPSQ